MTEMSAANQSCQNNKTMQDSNELSGLLPVAGESNHSQPDSQRTQPGIYADFDNTDMDYEHAYQPLHKIGQNVTRFAQDSDGSPRTTPAIIDKHDQPKDKEVQPGFYEDPNGPPTTPTVGNKDSQRAQPSYSCTILAPGDTNHDHPVSQGAPPGLYEDLDDANLDYDYAYQHTYKGDQDVKSPQPSYQNFMARGKAVRDDNYYFEVSDTGNTKSP